MGSFSHEAGDATTVGVVLGANSRGGRRLSSERALLPYFSEVSINNGNW